ncbi:MULTISPECIES: hypothetical protein [Pseudomonas syringae group]|uniref:hypothetical protein n=1 Tax=Pseudomonas syringae group TaxID=136849 RepID=UPI000EFF3B99|nr:MULTISPECIES: hypothetical protein [Pseudomonas syringae group]MBI6848616.1 hypothetical protein [Pseudomonas syringae]RMV04200.1 hypothetical protein ALP19_01735 [Pseudomonas syringae pv. tomato]TES52372.1 hypothetical protein E2N91_30005 [Pseudomonas syringae pv. tomato]
MKPVLVWSTHQLTHGWVLICVDVSLEREGEPEALLGYRRAVHTVHILGAYFPVIALGEVITEMTKTINRGLMGCDALQSVPASRARAFVGADSPDLIWCACGDGYPANSYSAGFMDASGGVCESCDAAEGIATGKGPGR